VNVATPRGIVVRPATFDAPWVQAALDTLPWPQFVKPAHAGDSRGIDEHARVATTAERTAQVERLFAEFGSVLVEEYVDGPEYTVLVARTARGNVRAYPPVRYDFAQAHTVNGAPVAFKSYALKTSALAPHANVAVPAGPLADALVDASTRIFNAFGGVGYARLDFRADARGTLHFLEINFTCSVFYPPNLAGSADHILAADPSGHIGFLECIIDEAIARHARTRPAVELRPVPGDGYGTFALRTFATGDVVFALEHTPIPLMTEPAALRRFQGDALRTFRQYAWPIAPGVYGTWHDDPAAWRPQNHSCDANSAFAGLDVVATRPIAIGDEVTLDYALAMDDASEPFDCRCGSARCRGRIVGSPGNSVSARVMHTTRRQR
jgi:D-alanine-D-alanine ligase